MAEPVIAADGLGKRFQIGVARSPRTLGESITLGGRAALGLARGLALGSLLRRRPRSQWMWALRDVSFRVERGCVLGIIGSNGAGKSTLLKILSRITAPSEGRAVVRGRVGSLLEVGTGFHPELTGRENIALNGAILGMRRSEIRAKFDEIVDFSGVGTFLDTPVKRYSSGMRVRLAFAVAAHLDPEILVIDEVLAVGDAEFQRRCIGKMSEVARGGRTVLFVSHNMAAIDSLCTRALLLRGGRLVREGEVATVIDDHLAHADDPASGLSGALKVAYDGSCELHAVGIEAAEGGTLARVRCGQDFAIAIDLHSKRALRKVSVQLAIDGEFGVRVSLLSSHLAGAELELCEGPSRVVCRVRDLPLVPGLYGVEVKVLVDGEVVLFSKRAAEIAVEGGNFFGSGRLPPRGWSGQVLIRNDWSVASAEGRT